MYRLNTDESPPPSVLKQKPVADLFMDNKNKIELPPVNKLSLAERNERRMSGYYANEMTGVDERGDMEEDKKLKEERAQSVAEWNRLGEEMNELWHAEEAYGEASQAFSLTARYNDHAASMLPQAKLAAERAAQEAKADFAAVEGKSLTAPDGTKLRLNAAGQFVDENNKSADPNQLAQMDWDDPAAKPFKQAQDSIADAQTKDHTSTRRAHQDSEMASMKALESMQKERLDGVQAKAAPITPAL